MMEHKLDEYLLYVCHDGEEIVLRELPRPEGDDLIRYDDGSLAHVLHHVTLFEAKDGSLIEQAEQINLGGGLTFYQRPGRGTGWKRNRRDLAYRRAKPKGERRTFISFSDYLKAQSGVP